MLDLVASLVVRAAIIYIVLTMNVSLHNLLYEKSQHALVKQNMAVLADILRNDMRYVGYNISVGNAILLADTSQIRFVGDLDSNGIPDTLYFYVGSTSELSATPNPNDRKLYRQRNSGAPFDCGLGITTFSLKYYDVNGAVTSDLSLIKSIYVKIVMQGERKINEYYPTSIWENFFLPSNI